MSFLDDWRFCPRDGGNLVREDHHVLCERCGERYYANAIPGVQGILERDGRVLLARRANEPRQGHWDLPGGFVEETEDPIDGLRREFREETGAEVDVLAFLGHAVDRYGEDGDHTLNAIYVVRITAGVPEPDDDVAELTWFAPDELPPPEAFAFDNTVEALTRWRAWKE